MGEMATPARAGPVAPAASTRCARQRARGVALLQGQGQGQGRADSRRGDRSRDLLGDTPSAP